MRNKSDGIFNTPRVKISLLDSVKNLIKTYDEFTLILQQLQNFIE